MHIDIERLRRLNDEDRKRIEDVAERANQMIARLQGGIEARSQLIDELTGAEEDEDEENG